MGRTNENAAIGGPDPWVLRVPPELPVYGEGFYRFLLGDPVFMSRAKRNTMELWGVSGEVPWLVLDFMDAWELGRCYQLHLLGLLAP